MRWSHLRAPPIIGLVVVAAGVYLLDCQLLAAPKEGPTASQIMARSPSQQTKIQVGANVRVSNANSALAHRESVIAADPSTPSRLVIAAICKLPRSAREQIIVYRSDDEGGTWTPCLDRQPDPKGIVTDPALAFGPDGLLYFVHMSYTDEDAEAWSTRLGTFLGKGGLLFFRSPNGGNTWESACTIRRFTDRPFVAVDCSTGQGRGRVYCTGNISAARKRLALYVSEDRAKTFPGSQLIPLIAKAEFQPGNPVVLSNGTVACIYYLWTRDADVRPEIHVLVSGDGGQSVHEGTRVPTQWYDPRVQSGFRVFFPQLCADTASSRYRDRLYAVWEDGYPLVRIMFAFSPDMGKTWVGPTILSEQPPTAKADHDYTAFMPSIAVNKNGAVAVTWYDRRGLPNDLRKRYPPGCNVRMRVSIDGGATWQPSAQINEQPIRAPGEDLADTAGIAADANGVFHPVWIGDSTGTTQVWTAAVTARPN